MFSRRQLLGSAALIGAAGLTAGCVTNPATGTPQLDPNVIQTIQNAVKTYVPAVETILQTAAALFGPGYAAIVTLGSSALNAVINALNSVVSNLPQSARLRLRASTTSSSGAPLVGYIQVGGNYMPVYGYKR